MNNKMLKILFCFSIFSFSSVSFSSSSSSFLSKFFSCCSCALPVAIDYQIDQHVHVLYKGKWFRGKVTGFSKAGFIKKILVIKVKFNIGDETLEKGFREDRRQILASGGANNNLSEVKCPICLEDFNLDDPKMTDSLYIGKCGHQWCKRCERHMSKRWRHTQCPVCRGKRK